MPKTIKEIKETVLSYGFNSRNYSSLIPHWIDEAVRNLFREANLRIKHTEYEFSSVSGTQKYELPNNFGSSISLRDLEETIEGTLERFVNVEELDDSEKTSGTPERYFIENKYLYFYPTPDAVRKYSLRYSIIPSEQAAEESSNPNIREDFYHLLEIYCLYKAFQKEGDLEMKNDYKTEYDRGAQRFAEEMNSDSKDSVEQVQGAWGW